jgi:hypothetical protein
MVFKVSNLMGVGLFVALSSCYLSNEVSHSTEVDGGNPSAVGGSTSAVGGDALVNIDKPLEDSGIEEALLPGAWQGRLLFSPNSGEVSFLNDWAFEFTDTEVVISYADVKLYGAKYSINRNVNPYQLDLKIESLYFNTTPPLTEEAIESINLAYPTSAIFRIENTELTIALSGWPFAFDQSPPRSFDPGEDGMKVIFELTSDR